jgi:hypothetical protein
VMSVNSVSNEIVDCCSGWGWKGEIYRVEIYRTWYLKEG